MLVIGDIGRWEAKGRRLPAIDGCHFADPSELGEDLLRRIQPDYVISALIGERVDALDIAVRLSGLSFSGAYRTLVDDLPNVAAVRSEVRLAAPGLDFDILMLASIDLGAIGMPVDGT